MNRSKIYLYVQKNQIYSCFFVGICYSNVFYIVYCGCFFVFFFVYQWYYNVCSFKTSDFQLPHMHSFQFCTVDLSSYHDQSQNTIVNLFPFIMPKNCIFLQLVNFFRFFTKLSCCNYSTRVLKSVYCLICVHFIPYVNEI